MGRRWGRDCQGSDLGCFCGDGGDDKQRENTRVSRLVNPRLAETP